MIHRARAAILLIVVLAAGACGEKGSVTAPSPNTPSSNVGLISGAVRDTAFRPLPGATVQMLNGPEAGTSATADAAGEFVLAPSSRSATQFRASKEGFIPYTVTINPNNTYRRISFSLQLQANSADMAGEYKLTITADPGCRDLPREARTRTYAATVTPRRLPGQILTTSFDVSIADAPFLEGFSSDERFGIGAAGDYVAFGLGGGGQPAFVEKLSANAYLAFGGSASASVDGSARVIAIATSLDGFIDYCTMKSEADLPVADFLYTCIPANASSHSRCESKNHQLVWERR